MVTKCKEKKKKKLENKVNPVREKSSGISIQSFSPKRKGASTANK
jgi:hypothetical protein